jgi:glycerol-3-phosphate O-acyltransferase
VAANKVLSHNRDSNSKPDYIFWHESGNGFWCHRGTPVNKFREVADFAARRVLYAWIRTTVLPGSKQALGLNSEAPVCFVTESRSWSNLLVIQEECARLALPSPLRSLQVRSFNTSRSVYCLEPRNRWLFWRDSGPRRSAMLGSVLAALRENPHLDVQMLSVSIFWGRAPAREKHWLKVLFADTWGIAGRTRKFFTILVHGRNTLVNFSEPLSLRSLMIEHADGDVVLDTVHNELAKRLSEQRAATLGPDMSHRRTLVKGLLSDRHVEAAIEQEAEQHGLTLEAARARARRYLYEIVAASTGITIQLLYRMLSYFWNRFYDGIDVSNVDDIQRLARDHTLIYVPCHRSHIDYLLLGYVIYSHGLALPSIAAGKNLDLPLIGSLLRGGGAFFIRRSFRGNRLYSTVLFEYLHALTSRGAAVKYFVEGGRSRTGRSLKAKPGMLAMTVRSYLREPSKPFVFVPVYIGYEKLIEGRSYLSELQGQRKKRETLSGMLRSVVNLRGKFGRVYVNFAKPIFLSQTLDALAPEWRDQIYDDASRPPWLRPVISALGTLVMTRVGTATAVNPINLIALVLLATPRQALGDAELCEQIDLYTSLLRGGIYGDRVCAPQLSAVESIAYAEQMGMLRSREHPLGTIRYFGDERAVLMTYYRNNVLHLFALPSMIACCFVNVRVMSREKVIKLVSLAYPFVYEELFLPWQESDVAAAIEATIEQLLEIGLLTARKQSMLRRPGPGSARAQQLVLLARVVQPLLERYYMILAVLQRQSAERPAREALEERCFLLTQRLAILYELETPDFYDRSLFNNFLDMLIRHGYVAVDEKQRLTLEEPLREVDEDVRLLLSNQVRHTILGVARARSRQ